MREVEPPWDLVQTGCGDSTPGRWGARAIGGHSGGTGTRRWGQEGGKETVGGRRRLGKDKRSQPSMGGRAEGHLSPAVLPVLSMEAGTGLQAKRSLGCATLQSWVPLGQVGAPQLDALTTGPESHTWL